MKESNDADLVAAAGAGDRDAMAELLGRHWDMLIALCRRALGDDALAEDAAQEAALAAMLGIDRLRRPQSFGAWLAGIGLNVCRRFQRQRAELAWSWEAVAGGVHRRPPSEPGAEADPAEAAIAGMLAGRIRRAVAGLPPGQRRAVVLMYFAGLTHAEIAAELGIPIGAVKARLHKGRAALRLRLSEFWREDEMADDERSLVPMQIREVCRVRSAAGRAIHRVVLSEVGGERSLPIWIGEFEAIWLALTVEGTELPRPGTYTLMTRTLEAVGGRLIEVHVSRLSDEVFYAELVLQNGRGGRRTIDARPSDALNLAALLRVPILADPEVLAAAAASPAGACGPLREGARTDALTGALAREARERFTSAAAWFRDREP